MSTATFVHLRSLGNYRWWLATTFDKAFVLLPPDSASLMPRRMTLPLSRVGCRVLFSLDYIDQPSGGEMEG